MVLIPTLTLTLTRTLHRYYDMVRKELDIKGEMFEWRDGEYCKGMAYRKLLYLLCIHASNLDVLPYTARMERKDELFRLRGFLSLCKVPNPNPISHPNPDFVTNLEISAAWRGIQGRRDAAHHRIIVAAKKKEKKGRTKGEASQSVSNAKLLNPDPD